MRLTYLGLIFIFILSGCSSDDDCNVDDWLKTYRGVKTCNTEVTDGFLFSVSRDNGPLSQSLI